MDRVPLEQTKTEETPPIEEKTGSIDRGEQGISEMQDMRNLSLLLGFGGIGFDGGGEKAEAIYKWAQNVTGNINGPDTVLAVKTLVKSMGVTEKGKTLLGKIYQWTRLDNTIERLKKEKEILNA